MPSEWKQPNSEETLNMKNICIIQVICQNVNDSYPLRVILISSLIAYLVFL